MVMARTAAKKFLKCLDQSDTQLTATTFGGDQKLAIFVWNTSSKARQRRIAFDGRNFVMEGGRVWYQKSEIRIQRSEVRNQRIWLISRERLCEVLQ